MGVLRNVVNTGNWNDVAHWDSGIPVDTDTVNFSTYTTTIPGGYTTALIGTTTGGSGGKVKIATGGVWRLGALATFAAGQTFEAEPGSELFVDCADNLNYGVYINGGICNIHGSLASPFYGHGASGRRPTRILVFSGTPTIQALDHLYLAWAYGGALTVSACYNQVVGSNIHVEKVNGGAGAGIWLSNASARFNNVCVHGCNYGIVLAQSFLNMNNFRSGETLTGAVDQNTLGDVFFYQSFGTPTPASAAWMNHARLKSVTQVLSLMTQNEFLSVANLDANNADGTLTALGTRGSHKCWQYPGTVTTAGGTGTLVPNTYCANQNRLIIGRPMDFPLHAPIPARGGQTISLNVAVTPNANQPANSVKLVLDPDNLYDAHSESAQPTPPGETTVLTVSGTLEAGSYKANVPWELRVTAYAAGGTVTLSEITKLVS